MKSLLNKLSNIQGKVVVSKDGSNSHFKSKYITLEAIVGVVDPLLRSNGLVLTNHSKNGVLVTTIREIDSGDSVESEFPLTNMNKPQEVGSAFTYARRYNLCNLLNIIADRDDDAEAAEGRGTSSVSTQTTTPTGSAAGNLAEKESTPKKVSFNKKAFTKPAPTTSTGDEL